jgi:hypothetical protein
LHERGQRGDGGLVVLGEQARDDVLATDVLPHELQARPQQTARLAPLRTHHVGPRQQVSAKQLRQGRRIDGVGLHLRVADRLDLLGVPEPEVNARADQEIAAPVPGRRRLDDGALRGRAARQAREVRRESRPRRRELRLAHAPALGIHGRDDDSPLLQVDAGVQHGARSRERMTDASAP